MDSKTQQNGASTWNTVGGRASPKATTPLQREKWRRRGEFVGKCLAGVIAVYAVFYLITLGLALLVWPFRWWVGAA